MIYTIIEYLKYPKIIIGAPTHTNTTVTGPATGSESDSRLQTLTDNVFVSNKLIVAVAPQFSTFCLAHILKGLLLFVLSQKRKLKCPITNAVMRSSFALVEFIRVNVKKSGTPTEAEQETAATYRSVAESYASETSVVNVVKPIGTKVC